MIARLVRIAAAFLIAVLAMAALGAIAQTLFVLAGLWGLGADIGLGDAASMIGADLFGFGPLYAALIGMAFVIAFLAAALTARLTPPPRMLIFTLAGGTAIAVMLLLMEQVFFGVPVIAGARSAAGFAVQCAIGALSGALFAMLTAKR